MAIFFIQPSRFSAGGGAPPSNLSLLDAITTASLTTNLKLCLDAGSAASYTSGQPWLDVSGGGYDFNRGATSASQASDPTFNGVADGLSSSEYWSFDGGDYFEYDTATPETWMINIAKNNAAYSFMMAIYPGSIASTQGLFCTADIANGRYGHIWHLTSAGKPSLFIANDTNWAMQTTVDNALAAANAWYILGVSVNEATGAGGGFFYKNGAYDQVSSSNTFNSAYSSPSTVDAVECRIGADGQGTVASILSSGSRMGWLAVWEGTALSKANMDTLYASLKGRYGL